MSILDAGSVVGVVVTCLTKAYSMFEQFLAATHLTFVWQSFLAIALVVAFILKPLVAHDIHAGISDYAKRRDAKKEG